MVAGYHKWRSMGRYVRKGERGIPILAPILVKSLDSDDEDAKELVGFKVAYVFDVSQTEGDPLPEPPDWKSLEQNQELQQKLTAFAQSKGISVTVKAQNEIKAQPPIDPSMLTADGKVPYYVKYALCEIG